MTKKVIDIFPPCASNREQILEPGVRDRKKGLKPFKEANILEDLEKKTAKPRQGFNKKWLILGLSVLVLLGALAFFTLPKAVIEVWPKTEIQTFNTELKIDIGIEGLDFENKVSKPEEVWKTSFPNPSRIWNTSFPNPFVVWKTKVIPGQIFREKRTVADVFPASAKVLKQGKAEGIIRVFNKHSFSSHSFIPRTRFISAEGKVFRTPTRITIPGKSRERGKIIPGHIDVRVVADVPGEGHNIGTSTFSIPGLVGTPLFVNFYAESFESMTGGFSREMIQVTEQDLEKAKNILSERAKKESQAFFENKIKTKEQMGFVFFDQAIQTEIIETFSLAKPGMEMENFNFQVKVESKTLIFKEQNLKDFAIEFIKTQIPETKQIHQPSLRIDYSLTDFDLDQGKMSLALEAAAKIYPYINILILENTVKGKSLYETKDFLEAKPDIIRASPKFWPFWVDRAPEDLDKIEIKLRFELD